MTRDQELWGVALWVEKTHGDQGHAYIGEQVARLALSGEDAGIAMWLDIAERFDKLRERTATH